MRILFALLLVGLFVNTAVSQQSKQLEFIPATEDYIASVNSYSINSGELEQYYVKDSKWVKNEMIASVGSIYNTKSQRIQYISGSLDVSPQLFVYSKSSGEFSFYYLTADKWALNENVPTGRINLKSKDIIAQFTPATLGKSSYIFAYSSDGKSLQLLEFVEDAWKPIDYFPSQVPSQGDE